MDRVSSNRIRTYLPRKIAPSVPAWFTRAHELGPTAQASHSSQSHSLSQSQSHTHADADADPILKQPHACKLAAQRERQGSVAAMAMARQLFLVVALVAAGSCSAWELNIRLPASSAVAEAAERLQDGAAAPLIHALRPLLGSGGQLGRRAGVPCDSWRLGVEAHNVRGWKTVPASCEYYVGHYMLGKHYRRDSKVVVDEAVAYAEGLKLAGKGKEVWIFDIDETSLSNLPYYAKHGFGTTPYNATSFNEYVREGSAPALPETLRLFNKVLSLGIKPVFLTGRTEDQRAVTIGNLRREGYSGWEKLLLKPAAKLTASAVAYKSGERQKLQDAGFAIVGNIGDQWSDILGAPEGGRTFKLPDPLYYIG